MSSTEHHLIADVVDTWHWTLHLGDIYGWDALQISRNRFCQTFDLSGISFFKAVFWRLFSLMLKSFEVIVWKRFIHAEYCWRSKCYLLTFERPCNIVDCKNKLQLCLKVNKRQRKCHANCVGGMPERKITTWCVGVRKIYNDGSFQPRT